MHHSPAYVTSTSHPETAYYLLTQGYTDTTFLPKLDLQSCNSAGNRRATVYIGVHEKQARKVCVPQIKQRSRPKRKVYTLWAAGWLLAAHWPESSRWNGSRQRMGRHFFSCQQQAQNKMKEPKKKPSDKPQQDSGSHCSAAEALCSCDYYCVLACMHRPLLNKDNDLANDCWVHFVIRFSDLSRSYSATYA